MLEQVAAIRKLNKKFDGFRLFAGIECDILRDGSLDFPDEILSQLDYVVASVHSVFNLSESEMTQRVIRAMENPIRHHAGASDRPIAFETRSVPD